MNENTKTARSYPALIVGIVSVSFAAIFIRLAEAPASSIAALRMIFSSLILLPFALFSGKFRSEIRSAGRKDLLLLLVSGTFLAIHFITWITSLFLTGVTSSIVFVTASPLFVSLYTVFVLRERVSTSFWVGISLAVAGGVVMGGGNIRVGGDLWKGDLLAICGAIAAAGYFLVGSRLRKRYSLITYVFPVYSVSALFLLLVLPVTGDSIWRLPARSYFYCLLMAVICQLSGHTVFNWALKRIRATIVTISILGEPIGTSLLALIILKEIPVAGELLGGVLILGGIFISLYFNPDLVSTAVKTDRSTRA